MTRKKFEKGEGGSGRTERAVELLQRIAALPDPERFAYREVCPRDGFKYERTFDRLIEFEYVERVTVGCGKWHYRITEKGRAVVRGEAVLVISEGNDRDECRLE
jgi:hypothetical protein